MSADLTIRHAHRTALRRIERGEPIGDLGECLGALYLHDLVRDDANGKPTLSDDGRKVLAAHDALVETRRLPRPVPELPAGWSRDGDALVHRDVPDAVSETLLRCDSDVALERNARAAEAEAALSRWEQGRRVLARVVEVREAEGAAVAS